jgi:hypothetical protein
LSYSHQVRTYDFDYDSASDRAGWAITTVTAVDVLEPLPDELNPYRAVARAHLRLLLSIDSWLSSSKDPRVGWVAVSVVLNLISVRGRSPADLAEEMGIPESRLNRSIAKFRSISGVSDDFKFDAPPLMM